MPSVPLVSVRPTGLELVQQRLGGIGLGAGGSIGNPLSGSSPMQPQTFTANQGRSQQLQNIQNSNSQLGQAIFQAKQGSRFLQGKANSRNLQSKVNPNGPHALGATSSTVGSYTNQKYNQIAQWARQGGWAEKDIPMAIAIAMAESGGNPLATHANPGGRGVDRGVWQVNDYWQRDNPAVRANQNWGTDPVSNAKAAYQAFVSGGGWSPWSTFKGGQYRNYLQQPSGYVQTSVPNVASTTLNGSIRSQALQIAHKAIGVPYHWGGNSLTQGVDCSGLVQQTYKALGISLPRTADEQYYHSVIGTPTSISNLRPGDLVAWKGNRKGRGPNFVGHIAIYAGNGRIIEAPDVGLTVRERSLRAGENVYGLALRFPGE